MSHDPIDDAFQKRHELNIALSREHIADLESEVAALKAQLAQHKASLPTCEKHKPDRGARSGCVICAGHALSHALSRIDYACGEPNEMECSDYDHHQDEGEVVKRVVALKEQLAARDEDAERIDYIDQVARKGKLEIAPSLLSLGNGKGWEFGYWPEGRVEVHASKTFREAVDAARKEQSK